MASPPAAFVPPIFWGMLMGQVEPTDRETAIKIIEKIDSIDQKFGILSLTAAKENLLMWAHYADEHKGAVVEIDIRDPLFSENLSKKAF
jgi:hypothetical protein